MRFLKFVKQGAIRDPDDDAIISCALGGRAKVICSGDDDLLTLNGYNGLEIISPAAFCEQLDV